MNTKLGYFLYAIDKVVVNKNNIEILDIYFGKKPIPLYIYKKDILDFIHAALPDDYLGVANVTDEKILSISNEKGYETLTGLLGRRCIVMITGFNDYLEYYNGGQNKIKFITHMDINGKISDTLFDYESREPSFEDLYPNQSKEEKEQFQKIIKIITDSE